MKNADLFYEAAELPDFEDDGDDSYLPTPEEIEAQRIFSVTYDAWIANGKKCACGNPITLDEALSAPYCCMTCFRDLSGPIEF